jgi:hypothetical protein
VGAVCVATKAEGQPCTAGECTFPLACQEGTCKEATIPECPAPM